MKVLTIDFKDNDFWRSGEEVGKVVCNLLTSSPTSEQLKDMKPVVDRLFQDIAELKCILDQEECNLPKNYFDTRLAVVDESELPANVEGDFVSIPFSTDNFKTWGSFV